VRRSARGSKTIHKRPDVNYSFLGQTSFHHFHGDSVIRVADPVQSNCLAARVRALGLQASSARQQF
jgi:hypothetical protein